MSEHLHNGHRQRMRTRIAEKGISDLQEHEVLEYLLYSFVPRKDTNELAHRLIAEFGSLREVLNANPSHLADVSGMTQNAALFLSVLTDIYRKYADCTDSGDKPVLDTFFAAKEYLGKLFVGLNEERLYAVALDTKDRVIARKEWTNRSRDQVGVDATEVLDFAKRTKAVRILLAHNHPAGSLVPSNADVLLTREIYHLLKMVRLELVDHLIFNDKIECYSFKDNDLMLPWQSEFKNFKEGRW